MIPTEKELLNFLKKHDLVNLTAIARHFDLKNATIPDLLKPLEKRRIVEVRRFGGSKVVLLRRASA
jgi:predicted ArsR family transcriptional regulator